MGVSVKKTVGAMSLFNLLAFAGGAGQAIIVARSFGTGHLYDLYLLAAVVPELVVMFTHNLVAALLLPFFHRWQAEKGEAEAWRSLWNIFNLIALVYIALGVLIVVFAQPIASLLVTGGTPAEIKYAAGVLRLLAPFIVLAMCFRVSISLNNAFESFVFPAFANVLPSLFIITSVLLFADKIGPYAIAIGIVSATAVQIVLLSRQYIKRGLRYWRPTIDLKRPETLAFLGVTVAMSLGAASEQINVFIDRKIALGLGEGMVSALKYGLTITLFAQGLFGVPLTRVSFTYFSKSAAAENKAELAERLSRVLRQLAVFYIPASVGLLILAEPIIAFLFMGGEFTARSLGLSAAALRAYSVGLIFYAVMNVLRISAYSLRRFWAFSGAALGSIVLTLILDLLAAHYLGHWGIALVRAVVASALAVAAYLIVRFGDGIRIGWGWTLSALKALAATAFMAAAVVVLLRFELFTALPSRWAALADVLSATVTGGFVYIATMLLLRELEMINLVKSGWKRMRGEQKNP
ncbi:MAG: oligosaccharide flippase family protein [bacterium]|nr:oligosaccharide flippase family protein [bacterium]